MPTHKLRNSLNNYQSRAWILTLTLLFQSISWIKQLIPIWIEGCATQHTKYTTTIDIMSWWFYAQYACSLVYCLRFGHIYTHLNTIEIHCKATMPQSNSNTVKPTVEPGLTRPSHPNAVEHRCQPNCTFAGEAITVPQNIPLVISTNVFLNFYCFRNASELFSMINVVHVCI